MGRPAQETARSTQTGAICAYHDRVWYPPAPDSYRSPEKGSNQCYFTLTNCPWVLFRLVFVAHQAKFDEAEKLYKRSLAIQEHVLGSMHPGVASTVTNLARLFVRQARTTACISGMFILWDTNIYHGVGCSHSFSVLIRLKC